MNVAETLISKLLEMGGKIVKQERSDFGYLGQCVSGHHPSGFERTTVSFPEPVRTFDVSKAIGALPCWTGGRPESWAMSEIEVFNNPEILASFGSGGWGVVFAVVLRKDRRHDIHYTLEPHGIREAVFG